MIQKIKTEKAVAASNILATAKYGKLSDEDKVKVWKIARALKPIATKFDEDSNDASEKFKEDIENFDERLGKAQQYEVEIRKPDFDAQKLPMGAAEYAAFIDEFKKYQKLVSDAMAEFAQADTDVDFEPIDEDAFGKLMASNDWNVAQAMALGEIICH